MSTSPTDFNAKIIDQLRANEGHVGAHTASGSRGDDLRTVTRAA